MKWLEKSFQQQNKKLDMYFFPVAYLHVKSVWSSYRTRTRTSQRHTWKK